MTDDKLENQILDAIRRSDIDTVRKLFTEHPHMLERQWHGGPCWFHVATNEGRSFSMTDVLLDLGVDKLDAEIADVIENGDVHRLIELFNEYPQMLHRGYRGGIGSWLLLAAQERRFDMAAALLDMGVDVNYGKDYAPNENALRCALIHDDPEMLRFFLEHGANAKQYKAVISAITGPNKHALELVKLLEKYGADLHEVFMNELTGEPMNALSTAIDWGQQEVEQYLRSKGCVLPERTAGKAKAPELEAEPSLSAEVVEYFNEHFGPVQKLSLTEIVPTGTPVTIHCIPPDEGRNHVTLFTTGLCEHPMNVPTGMESFARAEIFIQLPADWTLDKYTDPNYTWAQQWLRWIAQYPDRENTWLDGPATIIGDADYPQPLAAKVRFTALLLIAERSFTTTTGETVQLYRMTPLYPEEHRLAVEQGIAALMHAFDRQSTPFIVDLNRPNVAFSS